MGDVHEVCSHEFDRQYNIRDTQGHNPVWRHAATASAWLVLGHRAMALAMATNTSGFDWALQIP